MDTLLRRKEKGVLCKLVIEKSYDQINEKFLLTVLQKMGFGRKWIGWIHWCISTTLFFVLINGNLGGFLKSSRGLRQGDPLSPYLFVLGMEVFSMLIKKTVSLGAF